MHYQFDQTCPKCGSGMRVWNHHVLLEEGLTLAVDHHHMPMREGHSQWGLCEGVSSVGPEGRNTYISSLVNHDMDV